MKKSVLVLLALALSVASGCSSGSNPVAPTPIGGSGGGGGATATASIASWSLYPASACANGIICDESQVLRPNAEGRYEIPQNAGGFRVQVVFNNPRVEGRAIEYKLYSVFSYPETSTGRFGQTDPGTPSQMHIKVGFNIANPNASPDPRAVFEATEVGPGLTAPTVMKFEVPVKFR